MLTKKQYDLLMFIHKRVQRDGVSPSFDEMKEALDLRSKSGIHRLITALEERGFIRRLAHRARAVEIIRLPDNVDDPLPSRGGAGWTATPGRRPYRRKRLWFAPSWPSVRRSVPGRQPQIMPEFFIEPYYIEKDALVQSRAKFDLLFVPSISHLNP